MDFGALTMDFSALTTYFVGRHCQLRHPALPSLSHPALDAESKEDARIGVLDPGSEAGMTAEGGRREERGREDRGPGTVKIREICGIRAPKRQKESGG